MTYTPDKQGRGAWTRTGGLLPDGTMGAYYRLAKTGEEFVGARWATGGDTSDAAHAVHAGVKAIQALCGMTGAVVDGWFGPVTDKAVRAAQGRLKLVVDGIVGTRTMRGLLAAPLTSAATANNVPLAYLGGVIAHESEFDPGAVGATTPNDHGLPQINLAAFSLGSTEYISYDQAMDAAFSLPWTAHRMRGIYVRWSGKTAPGVDPWDVAILNHNSPFNAYRLASTGQYPTAQARQYVQDVRAAW